jgi:hypothetical protein
MAHMHTIHALHRTAWQAAWDHLPQLLAMDACHVDSAVDRLTHILHACLTLTYDAAQCGLKKQQAGAHFGWHCDLIVSTTIIHNACRYQRT